MNKTSKGRTRESADILIVNAEEMLTLAGSSETPRVGKQMRNLDIIKDGALAIREGKIVAVGTPDEIMFNQTDPDVKKFVEIGRIIRQTEAVQRKA
jgi:imidazolonepropionase